MSSGVPFELYMQPTIRKRYPAWDGWEIYEYCKAIAAKSGFGPEAHLLELYEELEEDYEGQLCRLNTKVLIHPVP